MTQRADAWHVHIGVANFHRPIRLEATQVDLQTSCPHDWANPVRGGAHEFAPMRGKSFWRRILTTLIELETLAKPRKVVIVTIPPDRGRQSGRLIRASPIRFVWSGRRWTDHATHDPVQQG